MDWATGLGYVETHTPQHILGIRLLLAALFGAMIGFEREGASGSAGLRTHILISVAACLFTLLAFEIYATALEGGSNNPDPIRAVEATTAGIAFLGAGAIFQARGNVRGLTTGAGMWLAGAVGVSSALGYYVVAFGVSLFAVLVLAALRRFAHRVIGDDDKRCSHAQAARWQDSRHLSRHPQRKAAVAGGKCDRRIQFQPVPPKDRPGARTGRSLN